MGILSFLKKDKKDVELDVPPPPPAMEEHGDLPEFPELDAGDKQDFDFSDGSMDDLKMPEFDTPKMDDDMGISAPEGDFDFESEIEDTTSQTHEEDHMMPMAPPPRYNNTPASYSPPSLNVVEDDNSFYVRVDDFRLMLGTIGGIRADFRKSDDVMIKFDNMKTEKDKSFEKIKRSLEDIQKKLIFVDKTLFKGE